MAAQDAVLGRVQPDDLSRASDETLLTIRDNLLAGLDRVAGERARGTLHVAAKHGQAPPSQSGRLTWEMLKSVNNALGERGFEKMDLEGFE